MADPISNFARAASHPPIPLPVEGGWGDGAFNVGPADDGNRTVAIVGGGPAGLALALALHRHGIHCEIFDARARHSGQAERRILALSHGTRQTLEWLGAWQGLPATAIGDIHISHRGGLGRARLSAAEQQVPALGYVVTAADLIHTLDRAVAQCGIHFHERQPVSAARSEEGRVQFTAGNAQRSTQLLAYAEGAVEDGAARRQRDYGQQAVLCTVATCEPHRGRAWERFTPRGPVALLPHGERMAVVYTCPEADAPTLAGLDDAAFLSRLQNQFGERIHFTAVTPRSVFPLGLRYRETTVGARQVWLGNAAQTLHPVAGQGYNLALRDIRELARTLGAAADPGADETLRRYAASRSLDRRATIGFTDSLVRLFSNDHPLLGHARGAGLLALDLLPPLRRFVANRMIFGARAWP